jgi:hypothetical protein
MADQNEQKLYVPDQSKERQFVKDSKTSVKPDVCPKCGAKKVVSCPGGASLKAVPGIWWRCEACNHQW